MGILGEDKIEFLDFGELPMGPSRVLLVLLPAVVLLFLMCVVLLTNDAAQVSGHR